ncbi:uncharacterized protein LOC134245486 [Saccostrea cucullata]|uniref:uncharacterized protein LOC134245486 n=1 Tax=Saccostrea cuccullata TaxID=36930 RepID=UPI002ED17D38
MRMESVNVLAFSLLLSGGLLLANECPRGEIQTYSPIFYFGEPINLTCTLKAQKGDSSKALSEGRLYFLSSKLEQNKDDRTLYGQPLGDPGRVGIRIQDMVNRTASKKNKYMHYVCLYDQESQERPCLVDQIFVEIEYKPRAPKSGSCVVYNWERMECYWDLVVEYRQLHGITDISVEYLNASLDYSLTTEKWSRCPLSVNGTQVTCVIKEEKNFPLFMGHYYFRLIVNNTKTLHSAVTQTEFMTNTLVKPAKVQPVSALANKTSIHLKWSVEKPYQPQLFRIRFVTTSDLKQNPPWKEINTTKTEVILSDLLPYREYTIWIAAIPLVRNLSTGFWSDTVKTQNTTLQDVPSDVPKVNPGFYACVDANCSAVMIFWKPIDDEDKNGIITKYRIITEINGTQSQKQEVENPSAIGYKVPVDRRFDTKIKVNVATEVGYAAKSDSSVIIPPFHNRPSYPENIVVYFSTLLKMYHHPKFQSDKKIMYVLPWMFPIPSQFLAFFGEINTEIIRVEKGQRDYQKELQVTDSFEKFAFGISVDAYMIKTGRFISSGIKWSQCAYAVDAVPTEPVDIDPVLSDESSNNTMLFTWSGYSCRTHRVGPVQNFTVAVCAIDSNEKCEGTPMTIVLSGNTTSYRVTNLIGGELYKITVTAAFKGGNSPTAQFKFKSTASPVLNSPNTGGAEGGAPWGIIAGIVAAVIAVVIIIIVAWKIRRCLKTPDVEIEVPTIKTNGEISRLPESAVTEHVPLLHSSANESSTPRTVPNGTAIPAQMHDNSYYESSENSSKYYDQKHSDNNTEHLYIQSDSGLLESQKSRSPGTSQTAEESNCPPYVGQGSSYIDHQVALGLQPIQPSESGLGSSAYCHSGEIDSYTKAGDIICSVNPTDNTSMYIPGGASGQDQSNTSSNSFDEFGYCKN